MPILLTDDNKILRCPNCDSSDLEVIKKGFDDELAIIGMLMFGPIGLVAGEIDSDKSIIKCLDCGSRFEPRGYVRSTSF